MATPNPKPGNKLPCNINLHPTIPTNTPAIIGPRVSPILPPVPCKAIAKPLRSENSRDKDDIADGCQSVIAIPYKDDAITAIQNVVDTPNKNANTATAIIDTPSIPALLEPNLSPAKPAGKLANPLDIPLNVERIPI